MGTNMDIYLIIVGVTMLVFGGIYDAIQSRKAFKKVLLKNKLLMQELQAVERQNNIKKITSWGDYEILGLLNSWLGDCWLWMGRQ